MGVVFLSLTNNLQLSKIIVYDWFIKLERLSQKRNWIILEMFWSGGSPSGSASLTLSNPSHIKTKNFLEIVDPMHGDILSPCIGLSILCTAIFYGRYLVIFCRRCLLKPQWPPCIWEMVAHGSMGGGVPVLMVGVHISLKNGSPFSQNSFMLM